MDNVRLPLQNHPIILEFIAACEAHEGGAIAFTEACGRRLAQSPEPPEGAVVEFPVPPEIEWLRRRRESLLTGIKELERAGRL